MTPLAVGPDSQCVVCSSKGVRTMRYGDIKPSTTPRLRQTKVAGKDVYYWTFGNSTMRNNVASEFLRDSVTGLVILWSPTGLTTYEVENPIAPTATPVVASKWSQIGKQLVGSSFTVSERLQQRLDEAARLAAAQALQVEHIEYDSVSEDESESPRPRRYRYNDEDYENI